jgi:squalene-hopene/tetraprenyl-beta-curcumene cyclase
VALALPAVAPRTPAGSPPEPKPAPATPEEPVAASLSLSRSVEFLDGVTLAWIREKKCASCHTGYPYLLARAGGAERQAPAVRSARQFFEDRVAAWDKGGKGTGYLKAAGSLKVSEGVTEVVAIAATLALHDAQATGKLHPRTRVALDRMWELQGRDGAWTWNRTGLAPLEHDTYYGAVYAALGVGHAPDGYARSDAARKGVARLTAYLNTHPAPDLHHKTWLLWASLKLDGLMTGGERRRTIQALRALQRPDGGWGLRSLGTWKRRDSRPDDRPAASDGYATGLIVYVLRQAGVPATDQSIRRGVHWLSTNQRASGRWFTPSLNGAPGHSISNAGTAFAVMALKACSSSTSR